MPAALPHPPPPPSAARRGEVAGASIGAAGWWGCVAGAAIVLLAPLLVVDVPPVLDYPNHLARMVVLAFASTDPVLSRMYSVQWSIIPNLAIDLVVPALLHVLPVHVAGRMMLAAVLLLPAAGVLAYHRALFGHRSLWPLGTALVAYNGLFLLGFMNFLLATGIAFLVAAAWLRWRPRHPVATSLLCSGGTAVIFFCHLAGVLFVAILAGAHESERLLLRWRRGEPVVRASLASAALGAVLLLPAAVLYRLSAFNAAQSETAWLAWPAKLIGLLQPVLNYNAQLDLMTTVLILGLVVICLCHRRWDMPPSSVIALCTLLGLYLVSPFTTKGGAWIDTRFIIGAGFMLFAGCNPRLPRPAALATAAGGAALLLVRIGVVAVVWTGQRTDLSQLRASIAPVPPGARVLVVRVTPEADPAFWVAAPANRHVIGSTTTEIHDAALLLIERRAFWPLLFANPSQQPVAVRAPYRDIAFQLGTPPDYHALLAPTALDLVKAPYLADWQNRFDDVLVLDAEAVPDLSRLLPGTLQRVNEDGFAALYRIIPAKPD